MSDKDVLAYLLDIDVNKLSEYKFHAAVWNGRTRPLDVYIEDRARVGEVGNNWLSWQTSYSGTNRWTRKYILSFMRVYPEGKDAWLFGGIFEVLERPTKKGEYKVKLTDKGKEYVGRLKITYHKDIRASYPNLETVYEKLEFSEILKAPYSGVPFKGYENISLDFPELESIVRTNRDDWRTALQNTKGIYVIFDKRTGKKYVGSAYGDNGIWHRWCCYVDSLHGHNKELKALLQRNQEKDMLKMLSKKDYTEYAKKNFRFTLLECWPFKTDDSEIIHRENFWKEALLSRGEFGYNAN